jgi:hypothetical protein
MSAFRSKADYPEEVHFANARTTDSKFPSPSRGRHAEPALECSDEGSGLGISEKLGNLGDILG